MAKVLSAAKPLPCATLRKIFRPDGVHLPIPFGWVAEYYEMYAAARRLRALMEEIPPGGKPRILAKWERG